MSELSGAIVGLFGADKQGTIVSLFGAEKVAWKKRKNDLALPKGPFAFLLLDTCGDPLGPFMVPLPASCPVRGQDGTRPRRAMASLAPPSPSVKKLESMARHILRLGPPSSDGKIRPAGRSGKGRGPQIGYVRPLLRWVTTTRAWLGAAKAKVPRRFSRSQFSVRRGLICCRGVRAHLSAQACEKGRP